MTMIAMISHRISVPIKRPDILLSSPTGRPLARPENPHLLASSDSLEPLDLIGQRALDRQAFPRRRAIESVAGLRMFHDEVRVRGLRDRPAMREHENIRPHPQRRSGPGVDQS